jgi:hypothetical protein
MGTLITLLCVWVLFVFLSILAMNLLAKHNNKHYPSNFKGSDPWEHLRNGR